MNDTPERPHETPDFEPAPPTEVGRPTPASGDSTPPPAAPPTQMAGQPPAPGQPMQSPGPGMPPSNPPGSGYGAPYGGQPYGGQPYGAAPGYQPPGGAAYGSPYAAPKKSSGGKTAAIIIGVVVLVVLLVCGGMIAFIAAVVNSAEDSFDEYDSERPGGPDDPITVEEGEAFEIDGISYAKGWTIQESEVEYSDSSLIVGLEGENEREDESSENVSLRFTFVDGSNEVGEISCSSTGSISYGNSEELKCYSTDPLGDYENIEVSASY